MYWISIHFGIVMYHFRRTLSNYWRQNSEFKKWRENFVLLRSHKTAIKISLWKQTSRFYSLRIWQSMCGIPISLFMCLMGFEHFCICTSFHIFGNLSIKTYQHGINCIPWYSQKTHLCCYVKTSRLLSLAY